MEGSGADRTGRGHHDVVRIRRRGRRQLRGCRVDTVFIDGMVKKWGGELVGVDYAQLAREGEASRAYLFERFGVTTDEIRAGL
jgi:hypothetical protein